MSAVYDHYKADVCASGILLTTGKQCSTKQLAYNQWINGGILKNPTPNMPQTTKGKDDVSYQREFNDFTDFIYPPELHFFTTKSGMTPSVATVENLFGYAQDQGLYNLGTMLDIMLDTNKTIPFNDDVNRRYIRYLMMEEFLGGLFIRKTPQEVIEGYYDPTIQFMNSNPIYQGGDNLTSPFLSLLMPPTTTPHNPITFFTGVGDYKLTRSYANWIGKPYANTLRQQYTSIYTKEDFNHEPWKERKFIFGTDLIQSHPVIEKGKDV